MTLDLAILALGFACGWWAHRRHAENRNRRVWVPHDPASRKIVGERIDRWLDTFLGADR